jgi:hypothetical protein
LVLSEESKDGDVEEEASCGETEILSSRCVLRVSGKAITVVIYVWPGPFMPFASGDLECH